MQPKLQGARITTAYTTGGQIRRICMEIYHKIDKTVKSTYKQVFLPYKRRFSKNIKTLYEVTVCRYTLIAVYVFFHRFTEN